MENIFIKHQKLETKKHSVFTLAGIYDKNEGLLKVGTALCSKKDQYNRKVGNNIAKGRAAKNPNATIYVGKLLNNYDVLKNHFLKLDFNSIKTFQ